LAKRLDPCGIVPAIKIAGIIDFARLDAAQAALGKELVSTASCSNLLLDWTGRIALRHIHTRFRRKERSRKSHS